MEERATYHVNGETQDRAVCRSPVLDAGFTQVFNVVLCDNTLTVGARLLYSLICSFAFGNKTSSYPSRLRLAKLMGRSAPMITAYIKELVAAGVITVERGNRAMRENNTYIIEDDLPKEMFDRFYEISGHKRK